MNATNNSGFLPNVSSINAAVAGASGAVATNNDTITANASVLSNTAIVASNAVNVDALDSFTEQLPTGGNTVASGAGGVFNASAAVSESTLVGNAGVTIGGGVAITVMAPNAATSGIFLLASGVLDTSDRVTLSSGGAIAGAGTDSSLSATLNNTVVTNSTSSARRTTSRPTRTSGSAHTRTS